MEEAGLPRMWDMSEIVDKDFQVIEGMPFVIICSEYFMLGLLLTLKIIGKTLT